MTSTELHSNVTGTWAIDPRQSRVAFTVGHMGFMKASGTLPITEGSIVVGEDPTASSVEAQLDPAGFDTGNPKRDEHVRSADFLDVEQFRTAGYRSTGVEVRGTSFTVHGELTVHGQTRPVTLVGELASTADGDASFTASATVSRHEFGVTKMPAFVVGKELTIDLEVVATR